MCDADEQLQVAMSDVDMHMQLSLAACDADEQLHVAAICDADDQQLLAVCDVDESVFTRRTNQGFRLVAHIGACPIRHTILSTLVTSKLCEHANQRTSAL